VKGIVVDASIALSWCFPDEQTPLSMRVLDRLKAGVQVLVPAFWSVEVLNSLFDRRKKGRISRSQTQAFLEDLRALRPTVDRISLEHVWGTVQTICRAHGLTPYDALYVELAIRSQCPLATLDQSQKNAGNALTSAAYEPCWRSAPPTPQGSPSFVSYRRRGLREVECLGLGYGFRRQSEGLS
jgi:predicted nucleic acid-binding protein